MFIRRVGKGAYAPCPPLPHANEKWWARGACHRAARLARTRWLCPPYAYRGGLLHHRRRAANRGRWARHARRARRELPRRRGRLTRRRRGQRIAIAEAEEIAERGL